MRPAQLTYAEIATELGISKRQLQQFISEERLRRGQLWTPDSTPPGSSQHFFSRRMADNMKKAWTDRRVTRSWKLKKGAAKK